MKWLLRIFITACISVSIAIGFSFLPIIKQSHTPLEPALPVHAKMELTDQNIVDYLIAMPVQLEYDRVNWEHQTLYIDLLLNEKLYSQSAIEKDLFELCYFSLVQVNNIQDLRVRVMLSDSAQVSSTLVMAMELKPSKQASEQIKKMKEGQVSPRIFLQSFTSLTYTNLWDKLVYDE